MLSTSSRAEPVRNPPGSRFGRYASAGILLLLLILWLWLFYAEGAFRSGPGGKSFGADFAMFIGAAQVLRDGGNPYDHVALYRAESGLMHSQSLPITHRRGTVRVGNPPLFFWLLEPSAGAPFQRVAWEWMAALEAAALLGFLMLLRYLHWNATIVPSIIFLLMPPVVFGAFYGNVIGFVFLAICLSLILLRRFPEVAGAFMVLAWLKPPVALPIVLLVWLFLVPRPRRFLGGFAAATAAALALTLVATGEASLVHWVGGLLGYAHDMAVQPDVASLAGLYVLWAPASIRLLVGTAVLAAAAVLTVWTWLDLRRHPRDPIDASSWLWFVWLLATPYAHFFDLILLTLPVLVLLHHNGEFVARRGPAVVLYLMFFSLLFIQPTPFRVYLLPFPILAAAVIAYRAAMPAVHLRREAAA